MWRVRNGQCWRINDHIRIIDVSLQITPHAIEEAAFLSTCNVLSIFSSDQTVHVVVVDPGVVTSQTWIVGDYVSIFLCGS